MVKITHLLKFDGKEWMQDTLCGQEPNCTTHSPVAVHHCITIKISQVSCAECADTYAEQNKTVEQHNLDTAFKVIDAKDKEISTLEYENNHLKATLAQVNEEYRKYQNNIIDCAAALIGKI
ncbi:Hypothetical protein VOLT_3 [Glutamicibacter phage Voltaire]|uniref:Hypothetical protein n=1 Tax=Glutamicibacter phage Voltaire TaxID=2891955 RepID=UPI00206DEE22|nr:Hypothetical protein QEJ64_gp03 [Glutamicibacter phage Voltaire]CAH1191436.1 Hypothetical protein VOLT_3 [Glutamicibacter phage Voltaire]